jgi:hypothetical protein
LEPGIKCFKLMKISSTTIAIGGVAAYFLFIKPAMDGTASPATSILNTIIPGSVPTPTVTNAPVTSAGNTTSSGTTYPYLVPGAPPLPAAFDKGYYLSYILPAMVQANPNVRNANYTLNATDLANYSDNYLDVTQWANTGCPQGGGCHMNFDQALQFHWTTYGPGDNRTFLPLPWNDMNAWAPAPIIAAPKKSSGLFKGILQAVTAIGAGVLEVGSAGALTPVVAPAAAAALSAESKINGFTILPKLNDAEKEVLLTGSAIIIDILPFYNQSQPKAVRVINAKLHNLLSEYAVPAPNPYKNLLSNLFNKN